MSVLPRPLEAVLFDLDGTLVDSAGDLADAVDRLLAEQGLPPVGVARVKRMVGDGARKLLERAFAAVDAALPPERFEAAFARFLDIYENELGDSTALYPHARETLAALQAAGIPLGLVTNKPATPTRQLLAKLELAPYFGSVIGGGDTPTLKPDPLPLQTAISQLGARPDTSLYVGDSRTDLAAARAAGVAIALLPSGYGMEPVEATESDVPAEDLKRLTALLLAG